MEEKTFTVDKYEHPGGRGDGQLLLSGAEEKGKRQEKNRLTIQADFRLLEHAALSSDMQYESAFKKKTCF